MLRVQIVMDNPVDLNDVPVSVGSGEEGYEASADLVKDKSLSSHQQDLLLALLLDYADVFCSN